ncbi:MAG: GatB/YqeY domain-containing protein [Saprospiraceae bacterium]
MSLEERIMPDLKAAMKAKDQAALRSIRAIKAAILLAKTDGSGTKMNEDLEIIMLQKLVKQRQDSYAIFSKQDRAELAQIEMEEIEVIKKYLPAQMSEADLTKVIQDIISKTGAATMKDMGKVMGMAASQLSGRADGKTISRIVKSLLT